MPGTLFNFPFDEELFLMNWMNTPDPTRTALYDCGVIQNNKQIQTLIANGSDMFTVPIYDLIGGTPENYDGVDTITITDPTGTSQSGVVYGRAHAWKDKDFIHDFNSGADPMKQITSQVAAYWHHKRQATMLGILNGIFCIADDSTSKWDAWQQHTVNIATTGASTTDANMVSEATAADAIQTSVGDFRELFTMAVMHSKVAANLAKLQLLQYRKYTDPMGIERTINIADWNGLTVIVDDGVPATTNKTCATAKDYTTYLFSVGALQYAPAPVQVPVEIGRDRLTGGGYNYLVTRMREALHPNGFSFVKPVANYTHSPTDAQLGAGATITSNWTVQADPKTIGITRIISNG